MSGVPRIEIAETAKELKVLMKQQKPGVIEAFKNHFPIRIKGLVDEIRGKAHKTISISYWFRGAKPGWVIELNLVVK